MKFSARQLPASMEVVALLADLETRMSTDKLTLSLEITIQTVL